MQAKWQGIDMELVYIDWAEALQHYSLGAINYAIGEAKNEQHPPSQGMFIEFCKRYKPPLNDLRLEKKKIVSEDGLKKIEEMKEMLAAKMRVDLND